MKTDVAAEFAFFAVIIVVVALAAGASHCAHSLQTAASSQQLRAVGERIPSGSCKVTVIDVVRRPHY